MDGGELQPCVDVVRSARPGPLLRRQLISLEKVHADDQPKKEEVGGRKDSNRGVFGMRRTQQRHEASTKQFDDKILEKEMR